MGKKGWWLGLVLALAVAVGAPLAVFGWMDAAVLGRDTPISAQTGKLAVSSSDLPLVEHIHNVLGETNAQEQSSRPATLEEMEGGMSDFLASGVLPQWVTDVWEQVCQTGDGTVTMTYGTDIISYGYNGTDGVSCFYTTDLASDCVLGFQLYTKEGHDPSDEGRQAVMERYIQYLGLDVLGDWVYNGNRYQSPEAQLFVNALLEEDGGGFSIGVELG